MSIKHITLLFLLICVVQAQRPFYAGLRPIGYPEVAPNKISNRFDENKVITAEVQGSKDVIKRKGVMELPFGTQSFMDLNREYYKGLQDNVKTYPIRPSF